MNYVSVEEAQANLPELIAKLTADQPCVILQGSRPVAQIVVTPPELGRPIPGRGKGKMIVVSEDDEHLEDFREYME